MFCSFSRRKREHKPYILQVDDEAEELVQFSEHFAQEGLDRQYELKQFDTSASFLKTLNAIQEFKKIQIQAVIQAVVLDYMIDELTGKDLAKICRKMEPKARIIMRSSMYGGNSDPLHRKMDLQIVRGYGAHTFIPKFSDHLNIRNAIEGPLEKVSRKNLEKQLEEQLKLQQRNNNRRKGNGK